MKKYLSLPNIYTVIALLYLCLGHLLNEISVLTLGVHGLFLVLTFWVFLLSILEIWHKTIHYNSAMKALFALVVVFIFYGLLFSTDAPNPAINTDGGAARFFKHNFHSIAPVFVFYYFSEKKLVSKKWFQYVTPLFLLAAFEHHLVSQAIGATVWNADVGGFTDNSGYIFLAVLPFSGLFKDKKWIELPMMIVLTILIISCMKRGPILCAAIVDIILIYDALTQVSKRKKIFVFLFIAVAFYFIYVFIQNMYANNEYFVSRIDQTMEGNDNNRGYTYRHMLEYYFSQVKIFPYLFGNGAYTCIKQFGYHAHNDWLEILLGMGLLGVIVYANYWIAQCKTIIKSNALGMDRALFLTLISIIICNFMKTLFSMSIDDMLFYSSSLLGFCLSQCNAWNINKNFQQYEKAKNINHLRRV